MTGTKKRNLTLTDSGSGDWGGQYGWVNEGASPKQQAQQTGGQDEELLAVGGAMQKAQARNAAAQAQQRGFSRTLANGGGPATGAALGAALGAMGTLGTRDPKTVDNGRNKNNSTKNNNYDYGGGGDAGGSFSGGGIARPGDATSAYAAALERLGSYDSGAPVYANPYDAQIADAYARVMGRGKFAYDMYTDPLYMQYRDQYTDLGQKAMRDTMGQAAALTGGYGSTYAQQAGQQAYNAYLEKLSDVVPELYDRAYQRYQDEEDRALQEYQMLLNQDATAYARSQDAYDRWAAERQWAQDQADREYSRQAQNLSKLQSFMAMGYQPTDQEIADAGLTPDQYVALLSAMQAPAETGSGYNPTMAERNAYYGYEMGQLLTPDQIKQVQREMGMENPDGVWGPRTQAAYEKAEAAAKGQEQTQTAQETQAQVNGKAKTRKGSSSMSHGKSTHR